VIVSMEHVVIFIRVQKQLQTVLCYTSNMIFITSFLKLNTNYIEPQGQAPQMKKSGCAPRLNNNHVILTSFLVAYFMEIMTA
jgi:hypothetical protein